MVVKSDAALVAVATNGYPRLRMHVNGKDGWQPATPETIAGFSALLCDFGRRLQADVDVPVGVIQGTADTGGLICWLPQETYEQAGIQSALEHYTAEVFPKVMAEYRAARDEIDRVARAANKPRARHPEEPRLPV